MVETVGPVAISGRASAGYPQDTVRFALSEGVYAVVLRRFGKHGYRIQGCTIVKRCIAQPFYGAGNDDRGQAAAHIEGTKFYSPDAVSQRERGHSDAITERFIVYLSHTVGKRDGGQGKATVESIRADFGNPVRNID